MLQARDIRASLGGTPVLRGVSLDLRPGEVLAVIGPNGAGKSTLLHALSAALQIDAGEISLDARPVARWPATELARRRAVLPQLPLLNFPLRAFDVVLLGRSPHAGHSNRATDLRIAEAALAEAGALALADRIYVTLSGGERQRVQLGRVLAQIWPEDGAVSAPGYLLLDEPTNNLDIAHQVMLMATARRLADAGLGVLAILHDPNLAAGHADRVAVLDAGRIVADGTPDEVMTPALFETTFGLRADVIRHPTSHRPVMVPA